MRPHHGCSMPEEHADYDHGAQARIDDEPLDESQPKCWRAGWLDMDKQIATVGLPPTHPQQAKTR